MTEKQAFKFAFLMGCARDGLTEIETAAAIARLEAAAAEKRADLVLDGAKSLAGGAAHAATYALPLAFGGAALAGGGVGALLAKLREGSFDVDAAKKHELIAAYNSFADEADQVGKSRRRGAPTVRVPLP